MLSRPSIQKLSSTLLAKQQKAAALDKGVAPPPSGLGVGGLALHLRTRPRPQPTRMPTSHTPAPRCANLLPAVTMRTAFPPTDYYADSSLR